MPTYDQRQAARSAYYKLIARFTGLLLAGSLALALLLRPATPASSVPAAAGVASR